MDNERDMGEYTVEYAVVNLISAKASEDEARKQRIRCEERVALHVPGPESGSKTITLKDGTKITVKRGWNYKADCQGLIDLARKLEMEYVPVKQTTRYELDEKGYEWYRQNDRELFDKLSELVTVTPQKVAVEVKQK